MLRKKEDQQKISILIATFLLLILVAIIGFGAVVVSRMLSLQANFQHIYVHSSVVSNAGLEAHVTLTKLHNRILGIILDKKPNVSEQHEQEILALDKYLREYFTLASSEFRVDTEKTGRILHLLDDWKNMRMQLISLVRHGQRNGAMKLASSSGVKIYWKLVTELEEVVDLTQGYIDDMADKSKSRAAESIYFVKGYLGGLAICSIFFVGVVIVKVRKILELGKQSAKKLHENEERMKLALSGADEGTWDLDIPTGRLNFDSQWGRILGYTSDSERPHYFDEWSRLIHIEDKDRVLKAMQDHVEGLKPEYKSEYRIRSSSGTVKWVAGHGKAVSRDHAGKAVRIVGVTRDITKKKQAEDTIWLMAHTDYLTGLPNRAMFYDRLKQSIAHAKRHNKKLALLFMDLDGFKQINDQFGHDIGDALLCEVAKRLSRIIRVEDTVARTGGDEFIFVLNDIPDAENAAVVANKIIDSVGEKFVFANKTALIGCSIGIAVFPDDSVNMETLITKADDAMYKAKVQGKSNYQFCSTAVL